MTLRIAVLYDSPLSRHRGSRRILRIVTRLAERHQVAFQPLVAGQAEPGEVEDLAGVETLPPLVSSEEGWPGAQRWSRHLYDPARVGPLTDRMAANIEACDVLWCCSWWQLGSELGRLGNRLGAHVVADGDAMSLGHMSKARAVWGVDRIRAVKELAWAARYLNWEMSSLRSASCVVVPSPREVAFVSRYTRRPVLAVRNLASDLVDLSGVPPASEAPLGVLFMGDMRFESNRHAARFLAHQVWPRLRRRLGSDIRPQLVLGGWAAGTLIGDAVPEGDPDFVVMSDVADVSELFSASRVVTVPVFFGGGSPHKVFEAAASGRPVICSRYVASTLIAVEESGFLVTDSADDYARHLASLLSDPELLCERQQQARAWVQEHYSLPAWNRDMNQVGHVLGIDEDLVA